MSIDRATFLAHAAELGVTAAQSGALYEFVLAADTSTEPARFVPAVPSPPLLTGQIIGAWGVAPGAPMLSRPVANFDDMDALSRVVEVLVWFGVLLVIGAHAWWSTTGYENLGIGIVLVLTIIWQASFLAGAEWAKRAGHGSLEAGFAAVVAFYTPLTMYSLGRLAGFRFEHKFEGFYPYISGGWVWMEAAAIAAAVALLLRYRRPFLMAPLSLFAGFALMDVTARVTSGSGQNDAIDRVVLFGGIVMIIAAIGLDLRGWRRFAFWPHLYGASLFAAGLPITCNGAHWSLYLASAALLTLGVCLARILYLAGGGLMLWITLSISARGALFPFVLMAGGVAFIALAIWLSSKDSALRRWLESRRPRVEQRDLAM